MTSKIKLEFNPETMTVVDMKKAVTTLRHITQKFNDLKYAVNEDQSMSFNEAAEEMMYGLSVVIDDYEV